MLIRYKDRSDKMVELHDNINPLNLPIILIESVAVPPVQQYEYGVTTYKTVTSLSIVPPYQQIFDMHGNIHVICIEEILDITIEAAHEYRQDSQ